MRAQEVADDYEYLKHGELTFLIELIRSLPDNPLVANMGAGAGTSGLAILEARDDSFLVTVDLYDRVRPAGALGNERLQVKRSKLMHRRGVICCDSALAGKNWWEHKEKKWWRRKVDMVFHDAVHNYDMLKAELEAWLPRVRAHGIIAVHDYTSEYWGGVAEAVDEVLLPEFKLIGHADTLIAFRKEKS